MQLWFCRVVHCVAKVLKVAVLIKTKGRVHLTLGIDKLIAFVHDSGSIHLAG